MEKTIGVGIIGLGGVGQRLLHTFQNHSSLRVEAVCDSDESKRQQVTGFPDREEPAYYRDYRDLMQDDRVSLVYVAVPPELHHKVALEAAKAKKHILCEKPLANSLEEAFEMRNAVQEAGIVHAMNFPTYYRACSQEFAHRLNNVSLGKLTRLTVTAHFPEWPRAWQQNPWINTRKQGGFIREVLPHFIHLNQKQYGPLKLESSIIRYPEDQVSSETSLIAHLKLSNGLDVLMDGLTQMGSEEEVCYTAYGDAGALRIRNWAVLEASQKGEAMTEVSLESYDHLSRMVTEVIKAINGQPADIITFEEGLQVQTTLETILLHQHK